MIDRGRHSILGVGINAVDYEAAVSAVISAAKEGRAMTVTCSAVHGVMLGALDSEHRARLNSFDMIVPDGQPVRWALRWRHGIRLDDRVRGVDFMLALCERAAAEQVPVFLFGSRREILDRLSQGAEETLPGAQDRRRATFGIPCRDRRRAARGIRGDPAQRSPTRLCRTRLPEAGAVGVREPAFVADAHRGNRLGFRFQRRRAPCSAGMDAAERPRVAVSIRSGAEAIVEALSRAQPALSRFHRQRGNRTLQIRSRE